MGTADISQTPVTSQASQFWTGIPNSTDTVLIVNQDLNNTVYVGKRNTITAGGQNCIPIPPNGSFVLSANSNWFVIGSVATGIANLLVIPGGAATFLGLTQGLGNLVIPSVQSPGFLTGVTGWRIQKNGNAEFNNITIRGVFNGTDFIINSTGIFFYSGPPGFGGLSQSIVPGAVQVTDPEGNTALPGITTYQQSGGTYYANNILASQIVIWTAPNAGGVYTQSAAGIFFLTGGNTFINAISGKKIELSAPTILDFAAEIVGILTLDNAAILAGIATPAAVAGKAVVFANTNGALSVVDGTDGNAYGTERLSDFLTSDTGVLVALTVVDGGPVGPRSYTIRFQLFINVPVANAQLNSEVQLPGGSTGKYAISIYRAGTFFGAVAGPPNAANGIAINLPAANDYIADLEGTFTVSASGNMNVLIGSLTAQGVIVEKFSRIDLIPV